MPDRAVNSPRFGRAALLAALLAAPIACAAQPERTSVRHGVAPVAPASAGGAVTLRIRWPVRRPQVIPDETAAIEIAIVDGSGAIVASGVVDRPGAAAPVSVTRLPRDPDRSIAPGTFTASAAARDASGSVLAGGTSDPFPIAANRVTAVEIVLVPASTPGTGTSPATGQPSAIGPAARVGTIIGTGRTGAPDGAIGDGEAGADAHLAQPTDVAVGGDGAVYVLDMNHVRVRVLADGIVRTFAGGGTVSAVADPVATGSVSFGADETPGAMSMALTPEGDVCVVMRGGHVLVAPTRPGIRYGRAMVAGMMYPVLVGAATPSAVAAAVAAGPDGTLYLADSGGSNNRVWSLDPEGALRPFAGTGAVAATVSVAGDGGPAADARFGGVASVGADPEGNVYVVEADALQRIRMVPRRSGSYYAQTLEAGRIYPIVGTGKQSAGPDVGDRGSASNPGGDALRATIRSARRMAFDPAGNLFFVDSTNQRIRRVDRRTGVIATVAGTGAPTAGDGSDLGDGGPAGLASFNFPIGLAFDGNGILLVGDTKNHRIRALGASEGD